MGLVHDAWQTTSASQVPFLPPSPHGAFLELAETELLLSQESSYPTTSLVSLSSAADGWLQSCQQVTVLSVRRWIQVTNKAVLWFFLKKLSHWLSALLTTELWKMKDSYMYECYFKILCYTDCLNQDYVYMPWAVYRGGGVILILYTAKQVVLVSSLCGCCPFNNSWRMFPHNLILSSHFWGAFLITTVISIV